MKTHQKTSTAQNVVKNLFLALMVMFSVQAYAAEKPAHSENGHDHSKDKHVEGEDKQKPTETKHDHIEGEDKHNHSKDKHDHGKDKDEHNHNEGKHDDHEHGPQADTPPTSRSKGK